MKVILVLVISFFLFSCNGSADTTSTTIVSVKVTNDTIKGVRATPADSIPRVNISDVDGTK